MKGDFQSIFEGIKLVTKDKWCWLLVAILSIINVAITSSKSIPILYILLALLNIFVLCTFTLSYYLQIYSLLSNQVIKLNELIGYSIKKVGRVVLVVFIEVLSISPFLCIGTLLFNNPTKITNTNNLFFFVVGLILYIFLPFTTLSTFEALLFTDPIKNVIKNAFSLYRRFFFKLVFFSLAIWLFYWVLGSLFFGIGLIVAKQFQLSAFNQLNLLIPLNTHINPIVDPLLFAIVSSIYALMGLPVYMILYKKYSGKQYFHIQKA